ncbi:hypothetical protein Thiowin_00452 [Thiorhodovibrio winogradskyi]|uniref:LicD family protein n=1 Tax=Thiorhodovibrio winogradskyi TaxID=77007 RepID=A0ABZ0S5T1_9GAMM|nr:hypothetical protein [Thiorhodovibrio winogradskyi]
MPWPTAAPAPQTPFDAVAAGRQLEQVLAALCPAGFHAFATGDALLGLVRDGRLMDHDKDLDVVVPMDEFARACAHLMNLDWQPAWIPVDAVNFRAFVHRRRQLTLDLLGYTAWRSCSMLVLILMRVSL